MSKCIGFGDKEGCCDNEAGTQWGPLWCLECDEKRIAHIDAQMQKISTKFAAASTGKAE